ncbi:alpha-mannosyltransferase [Colletotrichum plurivorum]|uniref:Alpha-mannosyltransferase n=1 Tax=Colletotrichum plurivorum TaxID=2175906 RepID=A0A8H6JUW7_9PEZI|nr:alpha-mannosyltransferase [Colletotrichum plurivorum]
MPAEVISLLSSPSLGPSPVESAPPPLPPAVNAAAAALTYSDDVFDLTVDSPLLAPVAAATEPVPPIEQAKPSYSPKSVAGAKRPRDEPEEFKPPVYFMSDDFDTTIDLDSSMPIRNSQAESRDNKRPRLSPAPGSHTFQRPHSTAHSTADHPTRPPLKSSAAMRRSKILDDPIEFSSSPGFSSRPTAAAATKSGPLLGSDPFASSPPSRLPPSVQPQQRADSPKRTVQRPAKANFDLTDYGLGSDDPFASSPQVPLQPTSKLSKPETITLDDDDDDDNDSFTNPPRREPINTIREKSPKASLSAVAKGKQRAESPKRRANWDPISSSAPERHIPSDPFSSPPPRRRVFTKSASEVIDLSDGEPAPNNLDIGSDDDFPDLDNFDATRVRARIETNKPASRAPAKTAKPSTSTRTTTKKSAEDRARDKEAKAADRERERERKKQEKEAAKEEKAREKQRTAALSEVNKIRTDKKVSTPEMVADLPSSLPPPVVLQMQTLLKDLGVQHTTWDSPVDNVVKWRRKVASQFNEELNHWEPIPMRIEREKFALVIVTATEFVALAQGDEGNNLEAHVLKMKRHFPSEQLLYLIEGLTPWMRKNRNVRNRQFVSAVRNQSAEPQEGAQGAGGRRRKNQKSQVYIDEDAIEDALLELQVMHNVLIHHTAVPVETAQWVAVFTQHISTVPYRKQREAANAAGAGFCMETGQVRTGEDVKATYVRMLQEIVRVTAPIAYGIATRYETVPELVKGLEEGGPLVLENLRKSTNKDGGFSDRAIGKAVSKRVYNIFTSRDPWSTDV